MERWRRLAGRQKLGSALTGFAVVLTLVVAALGTTSGPTPRAYALLLATFAAVAQFAAALSFNGVGRADPVHSRRSVERLVLLAERAAEAESLETGAFEGTSSVGLKPCMGLIGVHLSYIEEGAVQSMKDWIAVNPDAAQTLEGNGNDDGI